MLSLAGSNKPSFSVAVEPLNTRIPSATKGLEGIRTGLRQPILGGVAHLDALGKIAKVQGVDVAANTAVDLRLNNEIASDVISKLLSRGGSGMSSVRLNLMRRFSQLGLVANLAIGIEGLMY